MHHSHEPIQLIAKSRNTCSSAAQQACELTDAPLPTELLAEPEFERAQRLHTPVEAPQSSLASMDCLEKAALLAAGMEPDCLLEECSLGPGPWGVELHRAGAWRGPGAGAPQCPEVGYDFGLRCMPDAKQHHCAAELQAESDRLQRAVARWSPRGTEPQAGSGLDAGGSGGWEARHGGHPGGRWGQACEGVDRQDCNRLLPDEFVPEVVPEGAAVEPYRAQGGGVESGQAGV